MDMLAIRALALSAAFAAQGVDATVTPPGGAAVNTRVLWVIYARETYSMEDAPVGGALHRREPRRVLALLRTEVPSVPLGTVVEAAEVAGGSVLAWRVAGFDRFDADHVRVVVIPRE